MTTRRHRADTVAGLPPAGTLPLQAATIGVIHFQPSEALSHYFAVRRHRASRFHRQATIAIHAQRRRWSPEAFTPSLLKLGFVEPTGRALSRLPVRSMLCGLWRTNQWPGRPSKWTALEALRAKTLEGRIKIRLHLHRVPHVSLRWGPVTTRSRTSLGVPVCTRRRRFAALRMCVSESPRGLHGDESS